MIRICKTAFLWHILLYVQLDFCPVKAQVHSLPISKLDSSMAKHAKPILVLLSTDWCKYCQMQKNQLRKNKYFQSQADAFYYVDFDAESKENIHFKGQTFRYKPTGATTGIHELATAMNGEEGLSFPTWVLLNTHYEVLFKFNGVLTANQLKQLLYTLDTTEKK